MIREATYADLNRLIVMGEKFHQKSDMVAPFRDEDTANFLIGLIDSPQGVVLVSDEGMIGGQLVPAYCAHDWTMAVELFWWAEDGNGRQLLNAFEEWAQASGADEVRMTTLPHLVAAEKIMNRRGYDAKEISYSRLV